MIVDDWTADPDFGALEMPGLVLAVEPTYVDNRLAVLCRMTRSWWQFWMPKTYDKWLFVDFPESDPAQTSRTPSKVSL